MFSLQFESFFFAFAFFSFLSGFCICDALPTLAAAMLLCLLMAGCDFFMECRIVVCMAVAVVEIL